MHLRLLQPFAKRRSTRTESKTRPENARPATPVSPVVSNTAPPFSAQPPARPIAVNPLLQPVRFDTPDTAEVRQAIRRYLQQLPRVRILVNEGPGFGNQSAALITIAQIRELGYAGPIELIVNDKASIREKLHTLWPDFNPGTALPQRLPGNISACSISYFKLYSHKFQLCPLLLNPADDLTYQKSLPVEAAHLKCGASIHVTPTDFTGSGARDEIFTLTHAPVFPRYRPGEAALFHYHTQPEPSADCQLAFPPDLNNDLSQGLKTLSQPDFRDHAATWFAYGLFKDNNEPHFNSTDELRVMVTAAHAAGAELKKPVVIGVLSEIEAHHYTELANAFKVNSEFQLQLVEVSDLENAAAQAVPGDVIVVKIGNLPKAVFDSLIINGVFPPIAEGANLTAELEAEHLFLHGGRPSQIRVPVFPKTDPHFPLEKLHNNACRLLEGKAFWKQKNPAVTPRKVAPLSTTLILTANGRMAPYFEARRHTFKHRIDKLADGIRILLTLQAPATSHEVLLRVLDRLEGIANKTKRFETVESLRLLNLLLGAIPTTAQPEDLPRIWDLLDRCIARTGLLSKKLKPKYAKEIHQLKKYFAEITK